MNLQPFRYIGTAQNVLGRGINIMEELAKDPEAIVIETGERYRREGRDRVLAVQIFVATKDAQAEEVALVDFDDGSGIPAGSGPTCSLQENKARVISVTIDEERIVGDPILDYEI